MKTTYNKETAKAIESLKQLHLEGPGYEERDNAAAELTKQFYAEAGLGLDEEFELIEWQDDGFESAEMIAVTISGWSEYLGDESEWLWFDGKLVGQMDISCRGSMYRAQMDVKGRHWEATNMRHDGQEDKWLAA